MVNPFSIYWRFTDKFGSAAERDLAKSAWFWRAASHMLFFGIFGLREVAPQSMVLPQLNLPKRGFVGEVVDRRWCHLACSMDIMLSKFTVLEAGWLLRRAVTIVRDTFATSSS